MPDASAWSVVCHLAAPLVAGVVRLTSVKAMSGYFCLILMSNSTIVSELMQASFVRVTKSVPWTLNAPETL